MTDQRDLDRFLDAFFVEGTNEVADRVIDAALDEIDHTQQRRVLRVPRRFPTMNIPTRVAAAAVIGVLAVGATFYLSRPGQVAVTPPSPTTGASQSPNTAVVVGPSPRPSSTPRISTPSSSPEPCVTDQLKVLSGDALPATKGDSLSGLGQSRGVYLAGRQPMLWAVGPGQTSATLIATITPQSIPLDVVDISPDGSNALIRVGQMSPPGYTPECADLYMVRTDGSAVTRLTTFGAGRFVTGGAFSPDGRRVAFHWWHPDTITVLDLASGQTVDQDCRVTYGSHLTQVDWSPTGDRIAVGCSDALTIFDAAGTAAPIKVPATDEILAFSWTDASHAIVARGGGAIDVFDVVSQTSGIAGYFADSSEVVSRSGVFSPDGRWLVYQAGDPGEVPGSKFSEGGYLKLTASGAATRVLDPLRDIFTWSGDSRALVYLTDQWILTRIDVETLQRSTIGTITNRQPFPLSYRQGVWRIP
jgi:hypothetical protein